MAGGERERFLAERKLGIGGSDVAALFGLDDYKTAEDVWLIKTGQREEPDISQNPDVRRGNLFEPLVLDMLMEREEFRGFGIHKPSAPFVDSTHPHMRCNVDGVAEQFTSGDKRGETHLIEIKCPSLGAYSKIKREGLRDSYKLQAQHNLFVTGAPRLWWAIFCADRMDLLLFPMDPDPEVQQMLVEREAEFWTLVETMTPPPPVVREIAEEPEIMQIGDVTKRGDQEFIEAAANLREAKELEATAKQLAETAKARMIELVGDKPGIYESPGARVYYREQGGRVTFDKKALAATNPIPLTDAIQVTTDLFHQYHDFGGTPPADELATAFDSYVIDLSAFEKVGKPFRTTRTYFFNGD